MDKRNCNQCGNEYEPKHYDIGIKDMEAHSSTRIEVGQGNCPDCATKLYDSELAKEQAAKEASIMSTRHRRRQECGIPNHFMNEDFSTFKKGRQDKAYEKCWQYSESFPVEARPLNYPSLYIYSEKSWGVGKCIAADSLVPCADGRLKTISEICRWGSYQALTLKDNLEPQAVSDFIYDGVKSCLRIRTKLGREIVVTADHPLLTTLGWQKTKNLMVGESIAVVGFLPIWGKKEPEDYKIKLLAYLIGEGGLSQSYPIFTTTDCFAKKEVEDSVNKFHCRLKQLRTAKQYTNKAPSYGIYNSSGQSSRDNFVKDWLIELGLWGCLSRNKPIPDEVFEYSQRKVALFISRLFECDGWLSVKENKVDKRQKPTKRYPSGKKYPKFSFEIGYESASKKLVYHLNHLMLRFGINGTVKLDKVYKGVPYYRWCIANNKGRAKLFLDNIPFEGRLKDKATQLRNLLEGAHCDIRPIIWDKIKLIEEVLAQPVYDLSIPITENFIANDVVVHNTHLSCAIGHRVLDRWKGNISLNGWGVEVQSSCPKIVFISEPDLFRNIQATFNYTPEEKRYRKTKEDIYKDLKYCDLLILDDVGKVRSAKPDFTQSTLFTVITDRYNEKLPLIITANLNPVQLKKHLGEASFDRFFEQIKGKRVVMEGESFRRKK